MAPRPRGAIFAERETDNNQFYSIDMDKLIEKAPYMAPFSEVQEMFSESAICEVSYGGSNEDFADIQLF